MDPKVVQVALNGLENILRLGEQDAHLHNGLNPYAVLIEECYGKERVPIWGDWPLDTLIFVAKYRLL